MPNISGSSATRILRGPSRSGVLRGSAIENLIQQRYFSGDWYTNLFKGNALIQASNFGVGDDLVWQITTGVDGDVAFSINPMGALMTTSGSGSDIVVIRATRSGSTLAGATSFWNPAHEPGFAARVRTGASATTLNYRLCVGLFAAAAGNPNNAFNISCAMFHVANTATNGTIRCITTGASAVSLRDFDIGETWAATTTYKFAIFLDQGRKPHFYFNDYLVHIGPALPTTVGGCTPAIAIEETAGATGRELATSYLYTCQRLQPR